MIPFNDLKPLHALLQDEINAAVQRVIKSGWFILGQEVEKFEESFSRYHDISHTVAVANGTDAIELALRAAGVGPGDEVITVSHTAIATITAIERAGAKPVLVDIDELSFTMDPRAAQAMINSRTRALLPVHLYGQPADMTAIAALARQYHLLLIEDCAQAHGARHKGQLVGTFGHLAAFSFYPTKNLGAMGDGGAVITNDSQYAERLRRLRNYGQTQRYYQQERGFNSRLDELQAAILQVKLAHLDEHNAIRRALAQEYSNNLAGVNLPVARAGDFHTYHLFVIRQPQRDYLMESLRKRQIGTLIHYPIPNHLQEGFVDLGYRPGSLPITEKIASEILSLPLFIGLSHKDVGEVGAAVTEILKEKS